MKKIRVICGENSRTQELKNLKTDRPMNKIAIFCSSSDAIDPVYAGKAKELGAHGWANITNG